MGKRGILGGQRQKGVLKRQQVTLVPLRGEFMSTIQGHPGGHYVWGKGYACVVCTHECVCVCV